MTSFEDKVPILQTATTVDIAMIDTIVQRLDKFSTGVESLVHEVVSQNYTLPIVKNQSGIEKAKGLFKKGTQFNFDKFEPGFTRNWITFSKYFLSLEFGIKQMGESIKIQILDPLKEFQTEYIKETQNIKNKYESGKKSLDLAKQKYKDEYDSYNKLCNDIEEFQAKVASGQPPPPEFGDLKNNFKANQEKVIASFTELTEEISNFNFSNDEVLNMFEKIEIFREKSLNPVAFKFVDEMAKVSTMKKKLASILENTFTEVDFEQDLDSLKPQCVEEWLTMK